ncbi:hypothetical protein FOZ61_006048 [Perkinsus olseni]|uniref:phosphoglycerate mutase (2,3-diphosphoglycerate-independent) n=2 Tax=Perkinsus olseni TaxID=32597 RepID=A0A7J6LFK2_PEROL|nr:hypothetical protein FOZ61_006048 [Perkinsus olseni]
MSNEYTLKHLPNYNGSQGPLLTIVLDGYGLGRQDDSDCVHLADPTYMEKLASDAQAKNLYCSLKAHGTAVGLPSDGDMGNSEVGHNALGCGQLVAQGAKLVANCLDDGSLFKSKNFTHIVDELKDGTGRTLHMFGLLSDGNIHSHIAHVEKIMKEVAKEGVTDVRLHILTDGRDVGAMSAPTYVERIEKCLAECGPNFKIASGGGRMQVTMDRYNSDWNIVKRGYDAMCFGIVDPAINPECAKGWTGMYKDATTAIMECRKMFPEKTDQNYPPFVIVDENGKPVGPVKDGDVVICFNFRGDRSIQISRAFTEPNFDCFDRRNAPKVDYYGMLIYDNDQMIPKQSLAPNPDITHVLSEYMLAQGIKMYACAETHKFGHVTFFWNGNRSGYLDPKMELYEEVTSESNDAIQYNPAMKAREVTNKVVSAIEKDDFKFYRVNIANGDMVGHTGLIPQTIETVNVIDECVKKMVEAVTARNGIVVITADHGNCEEMKDKKGNIKTSHTLNAIPFIIVDPNCNGKYVVDPTEDPSSIVEPVAGITNVAATLCNLLGYEQPSLYRKSLLKFQE